MRTSSITILAFVAVSIAAAGCGDSAAQKMCKALAKKAEQCGDDDFEKDKKDALVAACVALVERDKESREELKAQMPCTKKDSCKEYKACRSDQMAKRRAAKIAEGKPEDIADDCRWLDKDKVTDGVKKACAAALVHELDKASKKDAKVDCYDLNELSKRYGAAADKARTKKICDGIESAKAVAELTKVAGNPMELAKKCDYMSKDKFSEPVKKMCGPALDKLAKMVDEGTNALKKVEFDVCYRAKSLAKKFGAARHTAVKEACAVNDEADDVKQALDKARANIAAKKPSIPYGCESTLKDLAKLKDSEWKTKQTAALIKTCYVELGVVVAENAKQSKYTCPFRVEEVIKAAKTHKLLAGNEALVTALNKHATCKKQIAAAKAK